MQVSHRVLSKIPLPNSEESGRGLTRQQIEQRCRQKEDVEVLELNIQPDHVHLVVSLAPKYSVSEFMGYLKGKLALRLFQQYEQLGKRY